MKYKGDKVVGEPCEPHVCVATAECQGAHPEKRKVIGREFPKKESDQARCELASYGSKIVHPGLNPAQNGVIIGGMGSRC